MESLTRIFYALGRALFQAVPAALGIVLVVFLFLQLVPGDVVDVMASQSGSATAENMAWLRAEYGLDKPVLLQFYSYLSHLAHFNLGYSPRYGTDVTTLILSRLPNTLLLMLLAQCVALVVGISFGVIMAVWANKWPDRLLTLLNLLLYSLPGFWMGLVILLLFSVQLDWLPSGGSQTVGANLTGWHAIVDTLRHAVLPVLSLSSYFIAIYARLTRSAMLEIASQDFVRTAHAKGLHPRTVALRHILRCALMPVTTVAGMYFGNLLGGAAVIETVFNWPGLGSLAMEAIVARDFNVVLGVLLLSAFLVVSVNIVVDVLQSWLDPRIEGKK
ncbi:ABC transporter permease [Rouxiella badensis]|jgi:peptide/nickel transport system permease protein|uniref:ABC transporter permease n=1 Tax=Rouxiella badensis TaxID=1646377 RepID=A0A1X0WKK9_9GAMM|nr:ABC transporter permease [Rouxiella badensis]MCC3704636.1 ABC transporter permease [Rouxiella badensis]MCC3733047.1 ABC transporter permease [Rouxiella badensis]MCC3746869.1 ABC transporter permease [Rouxiella badensis]MCC3757507.1 ABC transporter permease [Rouxiella badensis]ORJ27273.1 ABC transporter permease [Rouxiella badensis]